jgi:hypothetical protein
MKSSPHKRWKGHCLLCAENKGKVRGISRRWKDPHRVNRQFGKMRRRSRKGIYDYEN